MLLSFVATGCMFHGTFLKTDKQVVDTNDVTPASKDPVLLLRDSLLGVSSSLIFEICA